MAGRIKQQNTLEKPVGRLNRVQAAPEIKPVAPPVEESYFAKVDNKGNSFGFSDTEKDSSGKPYFAYRKPGDTSTTTDYGRLATKFDPRTATTVPTDAFKTERANLTSFRKENNATTDQEADHRIAVSLAGSNNRKNLKLIPSEQNQAYGVVEGRLQREVAGGEKSLFLAQTKDAMQKGDPAPFTGSRVEALTVDSEKYAEQAKKDKSLSGILKETFRPSNLAKATYRVVNKVLPGLGAIDQSIRQGSIKPAVDQFREKEAALTGYHKDETGKYVPGTMKERLDALTNLTLSLSTGSGDVSKKLSKEALAEIRVGLDSLREAVANHPARKLSKFANQNDEIPEVLGGRIGKFANKGDSIVTELGFPDSETARRSFDDYLVGKNRLAEMEAQYKQMRQSVRDEAMATLKPAGRLTKATEAQSPIKDLVGKKLTVEKGVFDGVPIHDRNGNPIETPKRTPKMPEREFEVKQAANYIDQKMAGRVARGEVKVPKAIGETDSLENSFKNIMEETKVTPPRVGKTLPQIVEATQTPVGKKVNLLDYFRTPDRVLEKIGLGKQAAQVRVQYDKYIDELPKNIEKITNWSKQVPAESNEKIFRSLDGEPVFLDETEKKVANEIRVWLKQWADRLGLPKDNRVSSYITHIFGDDIIKKEFDEDLAKIISDKVTGSVYDPFLMKRVGAPGYRKDTWAALDAYVKRGTRKVHMDTVLEDIQDAAGHLEESQWDYIKRYTDRINMRPTKIDNLLDNGIKSIVGYKLGQRPVARITGLLRRATYRGTLGLNVGSTLRNLSQGINTYSKLGSKYTSIGYAKLFSKENLQELKDTGILKQGFIQDRSLTAAKKFWERTDKVLFSLFETAERINRGAAYLGAKAKGLSMGKDEQAAIEYAKKIVRDTQFNFGSIDTAVGLQSDIAKTLTQLQGYTLKQAEFLTEMAKNKDIKGLLRYAGSGLTFVYTIGQLLGMDATDILPTFRFDTPATLKAPTELIKAGLDTPDKYGNDRTLGEKAEDVGEAFIPYIPAGSQGKKTIQGLSAVNKGGSYTASGKLQYPIEKTPINYARAGLFGKHTLPAAEEYYGGKEAPKTEFQKITEDKSQKKAEVRGGVRSIYDKAVELDTAGKSDEADALYNALNDEEKEAYKTIVSTEKAKKTKEGQERLYPIVKKAMDLDAEGKTAEADALYNNLSDDDKRLYGLVLKKIK